MKKKIVVVGGGTAGWITLSYLAATLDVDLTIIHSDEVDIIGVGESTTPTIKHVAETIGVKEHQWMRDAKATFKYGVNFQNFTLLQEELQENLLNSFNQIMFGLRS
jgi:tryptophan halogenase